MLTVSLSEGPLLSLQSYFLGVIGLVIFLLLASTIARKINLVDISDEPRKEHIGAVPLVGGIGLFVSLIYGAFVFGVDVFYLYLLGSLLPIMIVGVIDGIQGVAISPVYRIMAQILSSWIVIVATDIYIQDLGDIFGYGPLVIGQFGIPFTIFSVVGICNAFNMLDGKDGLLGSVSVVIMSSLLLLLYFNGVTYHWAYIVALSIVIYLAFNLSLFGKKRKIFLGDHGSTGLGHIIAWSLIFLSQETNFVTPASALWFVLLPLTDAILTFIRRMKSSKSVFQGDRLHIHHKLSDKGFSDPIIVLICSFITFVGCSIAIFSNLSSSKEYLLFYGYITLLFMFALQGFLKPMQDDR